MASNLPSRDCPSRPSAPTNPDEPSVPDESPAPDLPMSMTASMILTHLPQDASQALRDLESIDDFKGTWAFETVKMITVMYNFTSLRLVPPDRHAHWKITNRNTVVAVRFSPLPSAPALGKQRVFKISASQRFETVVNFLRKKLGVRENEALFCYVNSVFAPGLDEGVGNLYRVSGVLRPYVQAEVTCMGIWRPHLTGRAGL